MLPMRKQTLLPVILFFISVTLSAQQKIHGSIEDNETGEPVSYASVIRDKGSAVVTDSAGKFSLVLKRQPRSTDSISISAIGYTSKKIAIKDILSNNKIKLLQQERLLDQVKIFASIKGDERKFGYFREWKTKNDGGEIGYIFDLPSKKFQLGQVQVKINHNYDTCWLKLHLRDVMAAELSVPAKEILEKEVVLATTTKVGLVEFDLGWESINIPNNKLYVGFELLKCGCSQSSAPSFFFMGNEQGFNFFKETKQSVWKNAGDYTIYARLMTK